MRLSSSLTLTRKKNVGGKGTQFHYAMTWSGNVYAFEFKVARALVQLNILYDPEISVKSVCRNAKKYSNEQANKNTVAKCSSVAAQCGSAEREVASSNPGRTNTQGL